MKILKADTLFRLYPFVASTFFTLLLVLYIIFAAERTASNILGGVAISGLLVLYFVLVNNMGRLRRIVYLHFRRLRAAKRAK